MHMRLARRAEAKLLVALGAKSGATLLLIMLGVMVQSSQAAEARHLAEVEQADMRCALSGARVGDALRLSGEVSARAASTGEYSFTVRKSSASGTANVRQGGAFSSAAGKVVPAGSFGTSPEPDARYALDLVVTVSGEEKCRVSFEGPVIGGGKD